MKSIELCYKFPFRTANNSPFCVNILSDADSFICNKLRKNLRRAPLYTTAAMNKSSTAAIDN